MKEFFEKRRMYDAIMKVMVEEEKYNHKKSVVSANEILKLAFQRYLEMQGVLQPLKTSLSKESNITNIYFAKGFQDDTGIVVEYEDEEGKKFFTILEYYDDYIGLVNNTYNPHYSQMKKENEQIIKDAFQYNREHGFEEELTLPSTSGRFLITEGCNYFGLNSQLEKYLKMNFHFEELSNGKQVIVPNNIFCKHDDINQRLKNDVNVKKILDNVKVYEENVPKCLIKKR